MNKISSSKLTALIITKNEEPNIERVLNKLTWIERVVVLDSYSTDLTIEILKRYPNVEINYRAFDTFADQCNFGLSLLTSKWVLSIDADYVLTDGFIEETIKFTSDEAADFTAYEARFHFLVFGKKLLKNNTTPRPVLFQRSAGHYYNDGHAHRLKIDGKVSSYNSYILHDDRKSFSRWLQSQDKYSQQECLKLLDASSEGYGSMINKIRRTKFFAPFFVFFYTLFVQGLIFNGWAGWYYTLQRTMVEILFALRLIEETKFKGNAE